MNLRITADYPENEVKDIVLLAEKFVFENLAIKLPKDFKVWVKNCADWSHAGRFYGHKISLRIGSAKRFPSRYQYPNLKTAPQYIMNDWKEGLFVLTVHELWHYYQMKTGSGYSEIETERRSLAGLEYFRSIRMDLEEKWKLVAEKKNCREERKQKKIEFKKTPEYELQQISEKIQKIQRRLKLYTTKMKKLTRRKNFLQKKISNISPAEGGHNTKTVTT